MRSASARLSGRSSLISMIYRACMRRVSFAGIGAKLLASRKTRACTAEGGGEVMLHVVDTEVLIDESALTGRDRGEVP